MLNNIFLLIAPIFIVVEIWGLMNRKLIYGKLTLEKIETVNPKILMTYYSFKIFYLFWMIFGLFYWSWIYCLSLILIGFSKNFILLTKKNLLINLYDLFNCSISCVILIIIFLQAISQLL